MQFLFFLFSSQSGIKGVGHGDKLSVTVTLAVTISVTVEVIIILFL